MYLEQMGLLFGRERSGRRLERILGCRNSIKVLISVLTGLWESLLCYDVHTEAEKYWINSIFWRILWTQALNQLAVGCS